MAKKSSKLYEVKSSQENSNHIGKVGGVKALINSAGKPNVIQNPEIASGTGVWKNKKAYDRKEKKRSDRQEYNSYK